MSVAQMEAVQHAMENGTIIIATSTTTAYVLEELLGKEITDKGMFTAGVITARGCCITNPDRRYIHQVIQEGQVTEMKTSELHKVLADMGPDDIFVKGANAIDPFGQAGILLGGTGGGTIGRAWGYITANGITTIIAAGLEKLVPISLADVVQKTGKRTVDRSLGMAVGMMVVSGNIITEMEAFKMLTGVDAIPISGGGIDGGEGSKTFVLEGPEENIKASYDLVCSIKGEPALKTRVQSCDKCGAKCEYNTNKE
ncbi:MAG: hypothetical protein JSV18_04420 [Candidatus Bathyarchaeota archaeon]|nr:MAG: hypothetical protein JSV18_04420 [Candidatus Bathyarchaeota archaeon]